MLRDVWAVVNSCSSARPMLASGAEGNYPISVPAANVWPQMGQDLGARLESILDRALTEAHSAIAVGADTPLLSVFHLKEAIASLQTYDAVLGPSADGGFYLIGLTRCPAGLFSDLPWSTDQTVGAMRVRLLSSGFNISELGELSDVDTPQDIRNLANTMARLPRDVAPATRAWLSVLRCV